MKNIFFNFFETLIAINGDPALVTHGHVFGPYLFTKYNLRDLKLESP